MDDDIQEGDDPAEAFDRLRAVIEEGNALIPR